MLQLLFTFLLMFTALPLAAQKQSADYLSERIPEYNKRYYTFVTALDLMEARQAKVIVETGTSRHGNKNFIYDGGSTIIFADWAQDHHSHFYSVDISPEAIAEAQEAVGKNPYAHLVVQDSIQFLKDFKKNVDFLYLDSYDYEYHNPRPSQEHHLKEIKAILPKLTSKSVVMIDDCDGGGKGALVIPFLLERGWSVFVNGYQTILINDN